MFLGRAFEILAALCCSSSFSTFQFYNVYHILHSILNVIMISLVNKQTRKLCKTHCLRAISKTRDSLKRSLQRKMSVLFPTRLWAIPLFSYTECHVDKSHLLLKNSLAHRIPRRQVSLALTCLWSFLLNSFSKRKDRLWEHPVFALLFHPPV